MLTARMTLRLLPALLLCLVLFGCLEQGTGPTALAPDPSPPAPASSPSSAAPTVISTQPTRAATGVNVGSDVGVTFSKAMDSATLTTATITVTAGGVPVPGVVTYAGTTATLSFTGNLEFNKTYTLTVTTAARDTSGNALTNAYVSTFTTVSAPAGAINVKDPPYNAKGDGFADDSAAFTAAFTDLKNGVGDTLVIPAGVYSVAADKVKMVNPWGSPRSVSVVGTQATIKLRASGWLGIWIAGPNISVSGIVMDGANLATTGIEVGNGSTNLAVSKSVVENITNPGAQIPYGIRIEGNGNGMVFDRIQVRNVVATHPNPTSMVARGILIDNGSGGNPSANVTIQNSTFYEVGPKDDGDCIVIQNPPNLAYNANLQVLNNGFDRCHKRAIKIQVSGATIAGNRINNPFQGDNPYVTIPDVVFDMYSGISAYANNVTISGNTLSGVGSYYNGIEIGAGAALNTVAVTNNAVSNGGNSNISAPSSLIRAFSSVDNLAITGNTLDYGEVGLYLHGTSPTNTNIGNNTITRVATPIYW